VVSSLFVRFCFVLCSQLLSSACVGLDALVAGTAKALAAPAQAAPGEGAVEAEAARAQEGGEVVTGLEGREVLGERALPGRINDLFYIILVNAPAFGHVCADWLSHLDPAWLLSRALEL
jgi:hypothetical protein